MEDGRCKLGLAGRVELVRLIEQGATMRAAAAARGVAPATAHRWWRRWRAAAEAERASLSCLRTRSSRPHSCPWRLAAEEEALILRARGAHQSGPGAAGGDLSAAALADLEGAVAQRRLAPASLGAEAELPPLRVGAAWRAAAHGHKAPAPLHESGPLGARRPLRPRPQRAGHQHPARLRRAARRRLRPSRHGHAAAPRSPGSRTRAAALPRR